MLKDITLGQFLPGNSVIHRMDPRTKLIITMLYIICIFFINTLLTYLLLAVFVGWVLFVSKIPLKMIIKSIKPIFIFVLFTAVLNIFMTDGRVVFQFWFLTATDKGLYTALIMSLRLIFLVAETSVLTYTTSPIVLTDGLEQLMSPLSRFGFPSHELAMMMTIALRFIPTIIEETDKIMKAQSARGAAFDTGNIFQKAKAMIPVLVPLFISAFRRADELALAMECRGYHGGENRTKLHKLSMGRLDMAAFCISLLIMTLIIALNVTPLQTYLF